MIILVPYVLTAAIFSPHTHAALLREVPSTELIRSLRGGGALVHEDVRFTGNVDLTALPVVSNLFVCRDCTVDGDFLASNVVFRGPVDLSGLHVTGDLDLRGAIFAQAALFGSPRGHASEIDGKADFSLAAFYELADFEGVTFHDRADFALTQFRSDGIFTEAKFRGPADFSAAIFEREARFGGRAFEDPFLRRATFERTSFRGGADFRQRTFRRAAMFEGAHFSHRVDFGQATFDREAKFDRSVFTEGASFAFANFNGEQSELSASFERVAAGGKLDLETTTFWGDAVFRNVGAPAVSFRDASFHAPIAIAGISTGDLFFPLESVGRLNPEDRKAVLELVESSAKARGDLGLANDARFRLQVLASRDYWWAWRILDFTLYRGVAGYFVRPRRPLLVLLVFAFALTLYRELRQRPNPGETDSTPPEGADPAPTQGRARFDRLVRRPLSQVWSFVGALLDTLAPIVPGKSDAATASTGRRLEVLVYRVLVVCALLGFANSNPTLRQMFDALI